MTDFTGKTADNCGYLKIEVIESVRGGYVVLLNGGVYAVTKTVEELQQELTRAIAILFVPGSTIPVVPTTDNGSV